MKAKNFEELIKKYNPFGVKNDAGECMLFEDYGKAYAHVLKVLKKEYPRGFIDISLLLHGLTHQPLGACINVIGKPAFIRELGENPLGGTDYLCAPEDGVFPKESIERLFKAFHTISETQFAQGYFNVAWDEVFGESKDMSAV